MVSIGACLSVGAANVSLENNSEGDLGVEHVVRFSLALNFWIARLLANSASPLLLKFISVEVSVLRWGFFLLLNSSAWALC